MTTTITRGYTFGSTELVTNTKLHTLVDSATVSNFDTTSLASGYGLIVRSTSAPSNTDSLWVDTNQSPPTLKLYTGSEWQPAGPYGVFTNKSGSQRTAGEVVVAETTTDGSFTTTTVLGATNVLGIVLETIANNADGVVALPGARVTSILTDATTARGDRLSTSTTAGKATPNGPNAFATSLGTTTGAGTLGEAVLTGQSSDSAARSGFRNLKVVRTNVTTVTVTADELVVQGTSGNSISVKSVSVAPAITASGANGLDTGAEAANTIYYVWVIRKSSDGTVAGLLSTSSTAPTMPSGYDQKALVSAVGNNNSSDFINFTQAGKEYWFTTWATIASGNVGIGAWVAIDLTPANMSTNAGFVPSGLSTSCFGSFIHAGGAGTSIYIASVNTATLPGTGVPSANSFGLTTSNGGIPWRFDLLTADTLYWVSENANDAIYLAGFYLNKL